jgi:hypothetical protein
LSPKGRRKKQGMLSAADTPSAADPNLTRLFLIRPSAESPEVRKHLAQAYQSADAAGIATTSYPTRRVRLRGESPENAFDVLSPEDAAALYRLAHRSRALVLVSAPTLVRRDPRGDPPTRRQTITLQTFVQHKALYGEVKQRNDIDAEFQRFNRWQQSVGCTGDNDPRVLPLHVFEARGDWSRLGEAVVDREFVARFGRPQERHDDGQKVWKRTAEYHGSSALTVAGRELSEGLHWDVRTDGPGEAQLHTSAEVWVLPPAARGYLNVYPDADVQRSGKRAGRVKQIWPTRSGR